MIIICLIKAISPDRCQHSLDAINKKHMQGEDTELTKPPFLSPHYHHRKDGETHTNTIQEGKVKGVCPDSRLRISADSTCWLRWEKNQKAQLCGNKLCGNMSWDAGTCPLCGEHHSSAETRLSWF